MTHERRGDFHGGQSDSESYHSVTPYLVVTSADKAIEAGAESVMPVADQFYGDRHGGVRDPSGNLWWISTRVEGVPDDEMKRRAEEWMKKNKCD